MATEQERLDKLEENQRNHEVRLAVAESDIKSIKNDISSIKNNTTWLLRIVIGAILAGLLGLVLKGGFQL